MIEGGRACSDLPSGVGFVQVVSSVCGSCSDARPHIERLLYFLLAPNCATVIAGSLPGEGRVGDGCRGKRPVQSQSARPPASASSARDSETPLSGDAERIVGRKTQNNPITNQHQLRARQLKVVDQRMSKKPIGCWRGWSSASVSSNLVSRGPGPVSKLSTLDVITACRIGQVAYHEHHM